MHVLCLCIEDENIHKQNFAVRYFITSFILAKMAPHQNVRQAGLQPLWSRSQTAPVLKTGSAWREWGPPFSLGVKVNPIGIGVYPSSTPSSRKPARARATGHHLYLTSVGDWWCMVSIYLGNELIKWKLCILHM